MAKVRKIVTHPGRAHRDEFLACCLFIASHRGAKVEQIVRADPSERDMADREILVLDQGGTYSPSLHNLDHHQFDRKSKPVCSITQVIELMGDMNLQTARKVWNWLPYSEWLDSKGPNATAWEFKIPVEHMDMIQSPIERIILRQFGGMHTITKGGDLFKLMHEIGLSQLTHYHASDLRLERLRKVIIHHPFQSNLTEYMVADVRAIQCDDQPLLALELYLQDRPEDCPVTLTQDDRSDGLCLYRRNDDVRIDFSQIEGEPGVNFAHKNGFVAKIDKGVPWEPLLIKSHTKPITMV